MFNKMARTSPIFKATFAPYLMIMMLQLQLQLLISVEGRLISLSKPAPNDAAAYARWLVSQNSWGVLKYISLSFFPSVVHSVIFNLCKIFQRYICF